MLKTEPVVAHETSQAVRRPLSGVEKVVWMMSRRTPFNFVVTVRIHGPFSTDSLREAARAIRGRYRGLVARIVREANCDFYLCDDGVPDISVEERSAEADGDWIQEVRRQLALPFDTWIGPLARLVVVRQKDCVDLLAVCDHTVADGLSAVNLIRDLCVQMTCPSSQAEFGPLPESLVSSIPPEVFELRETKQVRRFGPAVVNVVGWYQRLRRWLLREPKPNLDGFPDYPLMADLQASIERKNLRVTTWSLSPEQTRQLAARCRREQTTVHAAIVVAMARGYRACGAFGKQARRLIETPINARKYLVPQTEQGAGLYNLLNQTRIDGRPDVDFWTTARTFRKSFEKALALPELFGGSILLDDLLGGDDLIKIREAAATIDISKRFHDLSISNLGRVAIPAEIGPLRIESVHGPAVIGRGTAPVMGVATLHDRMTFIMTAHEDAGSEATIQSIIDTAMRNLTDAVK